MRYSRTLAPLVLLGAGLVSASLPMKGAREPRTEQELRVFYLQTCARCHGADGSARLPDGQRLKGADLTLERTKRKSDRDLAEMIQEGSFYGLSMPSFKRELGATEIMTLVRTIIRPARKGEAILPKGEHLDPQRAALPRSVGSR